MKTVVAAHVVLFPVFLGKGMFRIVLRKCKQVAYVAYVLLFSSLTLFNYQEADGKIFVCKFSKMLSSSYSILIFQRLMGKQCRSR